ncbi:MAG: peptidylprolyl isomerase [Candidatus Aminicenantes bacterium]|nr:peptidylprolyl isomerase [Candidatus Aminicenantes bacterium]
MRDDRNARKVLVAVMAGLFFLLSMGCRKDGGGAGADPSPSADPQKRGRIILEVEGTTFTNADFDKYVRLAAGDSSASLSAAVLSRLYDSFIEERLFIKRAQAGGVALSDGEKASYLKKLEISMGTEDNKSLMTDQAVLTERLLVEKYLFLLVKDLRVDDKEIAAYYSLHKGDYLMPEKVQVSQILLASAGRASEVRDRLKNASEEEFRAMARTASTGPEASKGGVMGVFSAGQLPPELEKVIFPMKEGEIGRVVESTYGFHIFRLDRKFEARLVGPADAAPFIRTKLADEKNQEAIAAHLEELKASMDWKALPENLPFTYQRIES